VATIYHVTNDRNFANVKQHFQNPAEEASAHFVVTEDGVPHQFVRSTASSWTNGKIRNPRTDIHWLNAAVERCNAGLQNLNDYTLSIETMGIPHEPFREAQIATVLEITRYFLAKYPGIRKNRGHMGRHSDIDSVERDYCPGSTFPLSEIIRAVGGDPNQLNP
jgi:N-acetyl-anhydromuramyl-L-alanine amidase AmpD